MLATLMRRWAVCHGYLEVTEKRKWHILLGGEIKQFKTLFLYYDKQIK